MKDWIRRKCSVYFFLILLGGVHFTLPNSLVPSITTRPTNISLARGETARLHCKVSHLSASHHVVWRRGYDVLATGSVKLSPDPRLSVSSLGGSSTSLVISSLTDSDAGQYVCQVALLDGLLSVSHSLDVLSAPTVRPVVALTTVKEGEDATLECEVGGNPTPTVTWSRAGGPLPATARAACPSSNCLALAGVTRTQAGTYSCEASNGVGKAAVAAIRIIVQFPPHISVAHPRVHSGPGSRLRLVCEVAGEPRPALTWYFGETKVSPSPVTGVSLSHSHDKHSLTIERTDITSFGNYSCVARNKLGVFKKHIEVHGRPTEANFLRERSHSGQRSFELAWQVQSFVRILEYRLLYRSLTTTEHQKKVASSDWTNVIIPGDELFTGGQQTVRWRLDNLEENTNYECLVQARNEYGWSQPSKMFTFTTSAPSLFSPASQGLNWGGPASTSSSQRSLHLGLLTVILALSY